jgi:hypothetical protein
MPPLAFFLSPPYLAVQVEVGPPRQVKGPDPGRWEERAGGGGATAAAERHARPPSRRRRAAGRQGAPAGGGLGRGRDEGRARGWPALGQAAGGGDGGGHVNGRERERGAERAVGGVMNPGPHSPERGCFFLPAPAASPPFPLFFSSCFAAPLPPWPAAPAAWLPRPRPRCVCRVGRRQTEGGGRGGASPPRGAAPRKIGASTLTLVPSAPRSHVHALLLSSSPPPRPPGACRRPPRRGLSRM